MGGQSIKRRSTLRDVARQAGVSVATVSRVLNNPEKVVPDTRERIESVIGQLGYLRNPAARTLNSGRTMTVGAIVPTLDNAIFARFLHALEQRFFSKGFSLVISTTEWNPGMEAPKARAMIDMGAEALVVTGARHDSDFRSLVEQYAVPTVLTSCYDPTLDLPTIGYDNAAVALAALMYLTELGHTQIAVLHDAADQNDRTEMRLAGLRSSPHGGDLLFFEASLDIHGGRIATAKALDTKPTLTAILCLSDLLAVGALFELQSREHAVPNDISVMGFDNLPVSAVTHPPLTTMRLRVADMAVKTADAISNHLSDGATIEPIKLESILISRESTARRAMSKV